MKRSYIFRSAVALLLPVRKPALHLPFSQMRH